MGLCCLQAVIAALTQLPETPPLWGQALWNGWLSSAYSHGIVTTCHRIPWRKCVGSSQGKFTNFKKTVQINRNRLEIYWRSDFTFSTLIYFNLFLNFNWHIWIGGWESRAVDRFWYWFVLATKRGYFGGEAQNPLFIRVTIYQKYTVDIVNNHPL